MRARLVLCAPVAIGLALLIRPQPGGDVDGDLGWALTNTVWDFVDTYGAKGSTDAVWLQPFINIPVPLIILFGVAFAVWLPFKRSVTGRTIYAIGSAEGAAETPIANSSANHRAFGRRKPSTSVMRICEADLSASPSASRLAVASR